MNRGLIVSCQALPNEPLHSPFIMGRMALAAKQGGAVGVRANGTADIAEIKKQVDLPIIGIIKKEYPGLVPYITPTRAEVDALVQAGVEIVALDATVSQNEEFLNGLKKWYPKQNFMADISTLEEGERACRMGFEYVSTTLIGYTQQSKQVNKFTIVQKLATQTSSRIIAEGNFDTPEDAAKALQLGAYAVVVGSAITRPQLITQKFASAVQQQLCSVPAKQDGMDYAIIDNKASV